MTIEEKVKKLDIYLQKRVETRLDNYANCQEVINNINEFCKLYNLDPEQVIFECYTEYQYGNDYGRAKLEAYVPKTLIELEKEINEKEKTLDFQREKELKELQRLKQKYEK